METYSKEELQKLAGPVFDQEKVPTLHATSDAQFFVKKQFADAHAEKHKLTVYELEKQAKPDQDTMTVKALTEKIATIDDPEELNKLLEAEQAGANRATAIKALKERIEVLTKHQE